jgi:hypothetical protein
MKFIHFILRRKIKAGIIKSYKLYRRFINLLPCVHDAFQINLTSFILANILRGSFKNEIKIHERNLLCFSNHSQTKNEQFQCKILNDSALIESIMKIFFGKKIMIAMNFPSGEES